jgi:hypothetical protein
MNHAAQYCKTLNRVTKAELINALHQSLMQLNAIGPLDERDGMTYDNRPAIAEASRVLTKAGHIGFPIPAKPKGLWYVERSSGYLGHRCDRCAEWVRDGKALVCACDKVTPVTP